MKMSERPLKLLPQKYGRQPKVWVTRCAPDILSQNNNAIR